MIFSYLYTKKSKQRVCGRGVIKQKKDLVILLGAILVKRIYWESKEQNFMLKQQWNVCVRGNVSCGIYWGCKI